ncbi:hypothetical protein GCM10010336_48070 [Streptomyces goshikiensis]|nr:hypothetical protein GCM10010336_48070 [Streptomyces goshikiensis]
MLPQYGPQTVPHMAERLVGNRPVSGHADAFHTEPAPLDTDALDILPEGGRTSRGATGARGADARAVPGQ